MESEMLPIDQVFRTVQLQAVRVRREMEAQAQDSAEIADTALTATN
jgi:hypothetical protein